MDPVAELSTQPEGLSRRDRALIFGLALALRLLALSELSGSPWLEIPLGDARHFDAWGRALAAGDWGHEVFYQAPLYPYFLGLVYALFGHVPTLVRGIQCVLGALAATWIAAGTRRLAPRDASLAAGLLAAGYAPAIAYDLQLEKSSPAFALTAALFLVCVSGVASLRRALAAGLLLGALALLRENALVLVLPVGGWALRRGAGDRRAPVALAVGLALLLIPVGLRNRALGGVFLPTTSNAGVNFYIGNGLDADGLYRPLVPGRGDPEHEQQDAQRIAEELSGRALSPAEVSGFWFARALGEIAQDPAHLGRLVARKTRLSGSRHEPMDTLALEVLEDDSRVLSALGWVGFGLLLPLAVVGAMRARGRRHLAFTLACAASLELSILAFFVVGRFRLGLVPFLIPCAGIALAEPVRALTTWPRALAFLLTVLLAWWPLQPPGDVRAMSATNLASELLRRGDHAAAEPWARRALELDPSSAEAAFDLGIALRGIGREAEAVDPFERAMRLEPAYSADCLAELGAIHARLGDERGARELLDRALALEPEHASARRYLGALRERPGD